MNPRENFDNRPLPPHERELHIRAPRHQEELEPNHSEIYEVLMDLRERLERIERKLH